MKFPINGYPKLKFGFKFRQLYPASFGSLAGHPHLGLDVIIPTGTPIIAPCNGIVVNQMVGEQGGLTVWFKPDNADVIMRFMHNSKFGKKGKVKEGDQLALSGTSGSASSGPHCHMDISKHEVNINDINNFIDPLKYKWA